MQQRNSQENTSEEVALSCSILCAAGDTETFTWVTSPSVTVWPQMGVVRTSSWCSDSTSHEQQLSDSWCLCRKHRVCCSFDTQNHIWGHVWKILASCLQVRLKSFLQYVSISKCQLAVLMFAALRVRIKPSNCAQPGLCAKIEKLRGCKGLN